MSTGKSWNELISSIDNYDAIYIEHTTGNRGDDLIRLGLERLIRSNSYITESIGDADCIIKPGGAHLLSRYAGLNLPDDKLTNINKDVIVGPCSADQEGIKSINEDNLCKQLDVIFARDKVSYDVLQDAIGDRIDVRLCHDTAFYLKDSIQISKFSYHPDVLLSPRHDDKNMEWTHDVLETHNDTRVFDLGKAKDTITVDHYLSSVASSKLVITDRLHVAIVGWLAGIDTKLIDTKSRKCSRVYNMSLQDSDVVEMLYP